MTENKSPKVAGKTPLAYRNLVHQKVKSAVAVAGVAFCLILIFMQLGFFGAVVDTATVVLSRLRFDAIVVSRDYQFLFFCGNFPTARLNRAAGVAGVRSVQPFFVGASPWLCPPNAEGETRRRTMMVFGLQPPTSSELAEGSQLSLALADLEDQLPELRREGTVLVDRKSRSDFGPIELDGKRELGYRQIRIGGSYSMGCGFGADGGVIVSESTFRKIVPGYPPQAANLGLIRFDSSVKQSETIEQLRRTLPEDVRVLSRSEIEWNDTRYWIIDTPIGVIFLSGVMIAFFVGIVVTYQTLSNDIANHFAEYATLKAMGYGDGFLSRVVLTQALCLAIAGYFPAWLISLGLYRYTASKAQIPMNLSSWIAGLVFVLSLAMCATSAAIAVRKVKTTDPAELF